MNLANLALDFLAPLGLKAIPELREHQGFQEKLVDQDGMVTQVCLDLLDPRVNQDEDFQDLRGPWVNQELLASQGRKETPELKVFLALKGELVPLVLLELKVIPVPQGVRVKKGQLDLQDLGSQDHLGPWDLQENLDLLVQVV